jgi:hypothetical protein
MKIMHQTLGRLAGGCLTAGVRTLTLSEWTKFFSSEHSVLGRLFFDRLGLAAVVQQQASIHVGRASSRREQ